MATASIRINGVAGSKTNLALGDTVTLTNATVATTYNWYLLSQPSGTPVAVLSNPTSATATFTVPKEGSYLVKLVVNAGIAGEDTDQVVAAVRELETGDRIPAAGETTEVSTTEGWANDALNDILHRVTRLGSNGMITGVAASFLQAGEVVYISNFWQLGTTPQLRIVPKFSKALATTPSHMNGALGVMVQKVGGGGTVVTNERLEVQMFGLMQSYPNLGAGTGTVGDKVYVSNTGTLSLTPGTIPRPVGNVVDLVAGTNYSVFLSALDGGGASSSTPTGPAGGVLYGTYPNPTGLAADSSNYIKTQAYTAGGNVIVSTPSNPGSTPGSPLLLRPGSSVDGQGGAFDIITGDSTTNQSGYITLKTANAVVAGSITIECGLTESVTTGSQLSLTAGSSTLGDGGKAVISGGVSNSKTGGAVEILSGNGHTALQDGGAGFVSIIGGLSNTTLLTPGTRAFGSITVQGGYNQNAAGLGGEILLRGGDAGINASAVQTYGKVLIGGRDLRAGFLKAGGVDVLAGASAAGDTTTKGGDVVIRGGATVNTTSTDCGRVIIQGGSGGAIDSLGTGAVEIDAKTRGFLRIGKTNACFVDIGNSNIVAFTRFDGAQIYRSSDYTPAAGTPIPLNSPTWRLQLSANVVMTASPTIQAGDAVNGRGSRIMLINMSPTYTITFSSHAHSGNTSFLKLGANTRVLSQFGILELQYELLNGSTEGYWLEIAYRGSAS